MNTKKHASRAAGDLDPSFGVGGTVDLKKQTTSFTYVEGLALTPEGKILVTGATRDQDCIVVRLMEDGALDTLFGIRGSALFRFKGHPSVGRSVSLLDDRKILVVGTCLDITNNQVLPAASRLDANGDLDTTFGEGGYFVFPPRTGAISKRHASSSDSSLRSGVLPDGKILISHSMYVSRESYGVLIRLTANGVLDASFNGSGYTTVNFPGEYQGTFVNSAMSTPNGEILLGGQVSLGAEGTKGMLARYTVDGHPDRKFGDDGSGFIMLGETDKFRVDDLVAGEKSRFVGVGAMVVKHLQGDAVIFGRMADGAPDPDFNNGEITVFGYPVNTEWYSAVTTPTTHSIVTTGMAYEDNGAGEGIIIARYLKTGNPDTDFGGGRGWVRLEPGREPRLTLQVDGKMLICYMLSTPPDNTPVITRLLN